MTMTTSPRIRDKFKKVWRPVPGRIVVGDGSTLSTRLTRRLCTLCCSCKGMTHTPRLKYLAYCRVTQQTVRNAGIREIDLLCEYGFGEACLLEFRHWMAKAGFYDPEINYKKILKQVTGKPRVDERAVHGRALASRQQPASTP